MEFWVFKRLFVKNIGINVKKEQQEHSVKTLRSPVSTSSRRVLSGETQRCVA